MGESARDRADREFCSSKIVQQYETLYAATIKQASKSR
jgi:hypothetical protein